MRDSHRAEAERLLGRAVEEEVRRSGGRTDGSALLTRARGALDAMAQTAAEEYDGVHAGAGRGGGRAAARFGQRYARRAPELPCWWRPLPPLAAFVADLALGTGAGTAPWARALTVGVVGAAATVLKVTASHVPAAHRRAGAAEPARRPRAAAAAVADGAGGTGHPPVPRPAAGAQRRPPAPKKAAGPAAARHATRARRPAGAACWSSRSANSPSRTGPFAGRRTELARIAQWVHAARAQHRDQADGGRAARRPRLRPHHPRGPRGARPEGPVPRRVRGGPARRQPGASRRCPPATPCCTC